MQHIHYKSDFILRLRLSNPCGVQTGIPDFDFDVRLQSNYSEFMAGRRDGELYNCRADGDDLIIIADNHRLLPCAELRCDITYRIPDPSMPDGVRTVVKPYRTGIALVTDPAACYSQASFEALLPFIKGEDGKPGTPGNPGKDGRDGTDSGISLLGFMELVTDDNIYKIPVIKIPAVDIEIKDYYYYFSGTFGIGDWDIDLMLLSDEEIIDKLDENGYE